MAGEGQDARSSSSRIALHDPAPPILPVSGRQNSDPISSSLEFVSVIRDQSVVSDMGLAFAYIAQTVFVAAITTSSSQLLWRSLRSRGHSVFQIDMLMKAHVNPFTPSSFRAARVSFSVLLFALLATAMSAVSIFAPGSIKVSFNREFSNNVQFKLCGT